MNMNFTGYISIVVLIGAIVFASGSGDVEKRDVSVVYTQAEYQNMLESDKLVVVFISAVWCGPCKYMSGLIQHVAGDFESTAVVRMLNAEMFPDALAGVSEIPVVRAYRNGKKLQELQGTQPEHVIRNLFSL